MSGAIGPVSFSSARVDHYLLEGVPAELEGLCTPTAGDGAGAYRCPAWAYEAFQECLRRGHYRDKASVQKRNELLARLRDAGADPNLAEAEEAAWRLTEPPKLYRPAATGVFFGSFALGAPSGP